MGRQLGVGLRVSMELKKGRAEKLGGRARLAEVAVETEREAGAVMEVEAQTEVGAEKKAEAEMEAGTEAGTEAEAEAS